MPRVHYVKKARKNNPVAKRGESYYWWKFRFGGKRFSKTLPRQSQLTQSDKLSRAYAAAEAIDDITIPIAEDFDDPSALAEALREAANVWESACDELREVSEEYNESADNMEEYFTGGSYQIDEIREKADQLEADADEGESSKDEWETAAEEIEELEPDDDGDTDWVNDAQMILDGLPMQLEVNI